MKFAHLADTHLGYRQYGLIEREKDFYEVFEKVIDKIIEEDVDFVIHSGDLFETARPSPMALLAFQKGLLKLKGAGIPMYAIAGNHDVVMRKGAIPPQVIFKKMGLKVISNINPTYMQGDVFIAGLPFYPASHGKILKSKLADLSQKASEHEKSILVMHQGIDKYLGYQYELEIGEIPDNFDYYALGHVHKYINESFGKGKLVYPGSAEIWKTSELPDYRQNGKGFVVVDLDGEKPEVKRVQVELSRKFIEQNIDYDNLENGIIAIRDTIKNLDKKPILNITIDNVKSDTRGVYEAINEELGDLSLMIRPTFVMANEKTVLELTSKIDTVGPRELIVDRLDDKSDDIKKLAVDLYELLSKDKMDEARELTEKYYEDHYNINLDDLEFRTEKVSKEQSPQEETDDSQVTFKGGLQ